MAINEGIGGVEKLAYFLEIGEYLAENGASKVRVPASAIWKETLESAGLELKGIWSPSGPNWDSA